MSCWVINSLLDQDLYSFSQQQAILHHFPDVNVEYKFKCRNKDHNTLCALALVKDEICRQINHLCTLRFDDLELAYLKSIHFLKENYIEFLRNFQLQREHVTVSVVGGELDIRIKGNWFHTVLFEVPILAIVNEVYFTSTPYGPIASCDDSALAEGRKRLYKKIDLVKKDNQKKDELRWWDTRTVSYATLPKFKFADFGLRRRYSGHWQNEIVRILKKELPENFIGTSNVYLACKHDITPIGTMSHQWILASQGLPNVRISESQRYMLDKWVQEYRGDLGIALSDTLGFDAFLRDFDAFFAKLYDGCRHDSGDPYAWGEKLIAHYEKLKIDPRTKTAVFSDGLTFPIALDLCNKFSGRIKTSFGIGTNLTNDTGFEPLQIVIKLIKVNGYPVAKISDSQGKGMCEDNDYLNYLKSVFKIV